MADGGSENQRIVSKLSWPCLSLHLKVTLCVADYGPMGTQDVAPVQAHAGDGVLGGVWKPAVADEYGPKQIWLMMRMTEVGLYEVHDAGLPGVMDTDFRFMACGRAS